METMDDKIEIEEAIKQLGHSEEAAFYAYCSEVLNIKDLVELNGAIESFESAFVGEYNSFSEYAVETFDSLYPVDATVRGYIDWEKWEQDLSSDYTVCDLPNGGVAIFRE